MTPAVRLYYSEPLLMRFHAVVRRCEALGNGSYQIALDRTAFYPTSGGQPHDTGCLFSRTGNSLKVTDVYSDECGEVWHLTHEPLEAGEQVSAQIDEDRRMDLLEQHAGEHLIASAVWRFFQGVTAGLHTGTEESSIDVTLPDGRCRFTPEEMLRIETDVNQRIRRNESVHCYFVTPEEMAALPLRKQPTVKEKIRIVQYGDNEYCPCGGTHPPSAGMIGYVKLLSSYPVRGKARLTFLCGGRAVRWAEGMMNTLSELTGLLNSPPGKLTEACGNLLNREKALQKQVDTLTERIVQLRLEEADRHPEALNSGVQWFCVCFPEDSQQKLLLQSVLKLTEKDNRVALCWKYAGQRMFFSMAASGSLAIDLRQIQKVDGIRGGGDQRLISGTCSGRLPDEMITEMKNHICEMHETGDA